MSSTAAAIQFVVRRMVPVPVFMLLFLLVFLGVLILDTGLLLHGFQAKRVRHECLVGRLLLLLDSEQRILADLGRGIARVIRILDGNEALVGGT